MLCCGLFFATIAPAGENALEVFLDGLDTFSADFEQTLLDSSGEALEVTRGEVRLRRPGMFYWLYNEPYVQKIISDGATLWMYEEDLEQVTISDASGAIDDTPALIFSSGGEPDEYYVIEELENEAGHALVELVPKNPEAHLRSLRLVFSGDELSGMVLHDAMGQILLLTFANAVRNPELKKELFTFLPVGDMEVIDAR